LLLVEEEDMRGFNKSFCDLCSRKTWFYNDSCSEHSTWKPKVIHPIVDKEITTLAKLVKVVDPTPVDVRIKRTKQEVKPSRFNDLRISLGPNEALCVGCMVPKPIQWMQEGKIYVGLQFITKETEIELEFDGKDFIEVERHSKTIPVGQWRRGPICEDCATNYSTREIRHRDGSTSWEPVVQLQAKKVLERNKLGKWIERPTHSTTRNPGWSRDDEATTIDPPLDFLGFRVEDEVVANRGVMSSGSKPSRPRDGFQQVQLREKLDRAKERLRGCRKNE
jgi:hypothetical protein